MNSLIPWGATRWDPVKELEEISDRFNRNRIESSYGSFFRSFTLPQNIAEHKATADFRDGTLLVHLPKTEKAKPKSIEVKVA